MPLDDVLTADPQSAIAIVNARVWTGDPRRPWADALLVKGAHVAGIGSSAEIRKRAGPGTTIVDARRMMVLASGADAPLAVGVAASLVVLDRVTGEPAPGSIGDAEVVLALADGRVVVDRDSLVH